MQSQDAEELDGYISGLSGKTGFCFVLFLKSFSLCGRFQGNPVKTGTLGQKIIIFKSASNDQASRLPEKQQVSGAPKQAK